MNRFSYLFHQFASHFFQLNLNSIQLKGTKKKVENATWKPLHGYWTYLFIDFVKSNDFFVATFHHVATKKCFANGIKDLNYMIFKNTIIWWHKWVE
jgi:hypothetical protein